VFVILIQDDEITLLDVGTHDDVYWLEINAMTTITVVTRNVADTGAQILNPWDDA
jgi:hypothetical protein